MSVRILAFGIVKDIFGSKMIEMPVDDGATVAQLKANLEKKYPQLAKLASYMIAVNNEYSLPDTHLKAHDEIAIIPPVSGG